MPPPGGGKGNAYRRDMGVNEKFVELSRKSAIEAAQLVCALDTEKEREVLDLVTSSTMVGTRMRCGRVTDSCASASEGVGARVVCSDQSGAAG